MSVVNEKKRFVSHFYAKELSNEVFEEVEKGALKAKDWSTEVRQTGIFEKNTYTYIHTYIYIHTHTHTHIYIYIHTHTYIYIYTHTHTYIHIYIYTHTHKHTDDGYIEGASVCDGRWTKGPAHLPGAPVRRLRQGTVAGDAQTEADLALRGPTAGPPWVPEPPQSPLIFLCLTTPCLTLLFICCPCGWASRDVR